MACVCRFQFLATLWQTSGLRALCILFMALVIFFVIAALNFFKIFARKSVLLTILYV